MRAWPKQIADIYPLAEEVHWSERPWWKKADLLQKQFVFRRDGHTIHELASVEAAKIDGLYPLSHPGFRVGQVWGNESGDAVVIQRVKNGYPKVLQDYAGATHALLISLDAQRFCFLIADPCCPWLAPWSPVEADASKEESR